MRWLDIFEFSSDFVGKNEFDQVGCIEVDSFDYEFVMFFMHDPFVEN